MPAPRKFHGIIGFEYSIDDGSTWVPVTNLVGNLSGVAFEDETDAMQDPYGNNYRGPGFRVYSVTAIDRTAYNALVSRHQGDSETLYRWTLDQAELHTTDVAILPQQLKWVDIEGVVANRSNAFLIVIRIDEANITETVA
jgi:hypothetical protein